MIKKLQNYWVRKGCIICQSVDIEVGAGTSHPMTFLRAIGPEPILTAYVQATRRPTDGRYCENPYRLQHYYQFQVIFKPTPYNLQDLYISSLNELGIDLKINDLRFLEDNWENPTLGAWGIGWEVLLNGIEITQFTYFQQMGGLECNPVTGEITYGLERLAMYLQNVDNVYDLIWFDGPLGRITYGDLFYNNERENTIYNLKYSNISVLLKNFEQYEKEVNFLLNLVNPLPLVAYERILKAAHIFNLLDARKYFSITERKRYILRIRNLTKLLAKVYYSFRESIGFPMCSKINI